MKAEPEAIRGIITASLVIYLFGIMVSMWFLDLIAQQRAFALFLSSELVAFAMLIYLYKEASYDQVNKSWLFLGVIGMLFLVLEAITVSL